MLPFQPLKHQFIAQPTPQWLVVAADKIRPSVYTDRITDRLYSFFGKLQRCDDMDFFHTILPME